MTNVMLITGQIVITTILVLMTLLILWIVFSMAFPHTEKRVRYRIDMAMSRRINVGEDKE